MKLRPRLTYANVLSTLCFFLLLSGGAAYASTQLGKNSVGTPQLKNKAVTLPKIDLAAQHALEGEGGRAGSPGAPGSPGKEGVVGKEGQKGLTGTNGTSKLVVRSATVNIEGGGEHLGDAVAACKSGEHATGGGEFNTPNSGAPEEEIRISAPSVNVTEEGATFPEVAADGQAASQWLVEAINYSPITRSLTAYVVCASP